MEQNRGSAQLVFLKLSYQPSSCTDSVVSRSYSLYGQTRTKVKSVGRKFVKFVIAGVEESAAPLPAPPPPGVLRHVGDDRVGGGRQNGERHEGDGRVHAGVALVLQVQVTAASAVTCSAHKREQASIN